MQGQHILSTTGGDTFRPPNRTARPKPQMSRERGKPTLRSHCLLQRVLDSVYACPSS